jgi:exodeoxyribonuclease VII small subunit
MPFFTLAMVKSAPPKTAAEPGPAVHPSVPVPDRPVHDRPLPPVPASYEAAVAELERLVGAMEGAQLPLDELLGAYQRGAQLLDFCRGRLEAVEQQVKRLEDGRLEAWNDKS